MSVPVVKKYRCIKGTGCVENIHGSFTDLTICKNFCSPPKKNKLLLPLLIIFLIVGGITLISIIYFVVKRNSR